MDISISEVMKILLFFDKNIYIYILLQPHREEHFNNSFTSNRIITSKQSTQGTVRKTRNNDSVALMPLPFSTQKRRDQQFMNTFSSNYETNNYTCTSMNEPVKSLKGASQLENNKSKVMFTKLFQFFFNFCDLQIFRVKTIFCTGSIERILRWKRNLEDVFCIYETIGEYFIRNMHIADIVHFKFIFSPNCVTSRGKGEKSKDYASPRQKGPYSSSSILYKYPY